MKTPHQALQLAISSLGSQAKLAELLGVTPARVSQILSKGEGLPVQHVLTVERATQVPRHLLRPDIYPPPGEVANA